MAFSLSPSVDVREFDLSLTVPNLPSAKTGMVLPAEKGPCGVITALASEADLVNKFGKPNADNFKEWFNAWNFLQYASSLYAVRPLPNTAASVAALNAMIGFNEAAGVTTFTNGANPSGSQFAMHNDELALAAIEYQGSSLAPGKRLAFFNKSITAKQDLAFAICSSADKWNSQLANDKLAKGQIIFTAGVAGCVLDSGTLRYPAGTNTLKLASVDAFTVGDGFVFNNKNTVITGIDTGTKIITFTPALTANVDQIAITDIVFTVGTAGCVDNAGTGRYPIGVSTLKVASLVGLSVGSGFVVGGESKVITDIDTLTDIITFSPALGINVDENVITVLENPTYLCSYDYIYDPALVKKTVLGSGAVGDYIIGGSAVAEELVTFNDLFEFEPDWSKDEFAVIILDKSETGKYDIGETFTVSYNETARDYNGRNMFAQVVITSSSKLVYCIVDTTLTEKIDTADTALARLTGTADTLPDSITKNEVVAAQDLFKDPEAFDVNILISSNLDVDGMPTIAATRKDCVAIVAPYDETELVGKSATDATVVITANFGVKTPLNAGRDYSAFTDYAAVYGNMKYQYDKYNDINRWVPVHGDIAGLYAQTDANRDPWWAAAGLERGKVKNAIKLIFNPNKQNRDELYVNAVNPIMSIPGEGNAIVWGQKTATARPSAFDRVNVRRLLITVEKAVATAARYGLFEFNDAFTRTRLYTLIEPFLRQVKARRGLYDYLVVIDESNNGPDVVDANALVIDVYLKPTKVAEFIQVNMKVTRSDANFQELVGNAP